MARARLVVADTNSEEIDQMRRTLNNLLVALEQAGANIVAGDTAEVVLQSLGEGIAAGADTDPQTTLVSGTASGVELVGMKPTPLHPRRRGLSKTVDMDASSDF